MDSVISLFWIVDISFIGYRRNRGKRVREESPLTMELKY